jgi:hypothetical protein
MYKTWIKLQFFAGRYPVFPTFVEEAVFSALYDFDSFAKN